MRSPKNGVQLAGREPEDPARAGTHEEVTERERESRERQVSPLAPLPLSLHTSLCLLRLKHRRLSSLFCPSFPAASGPFSLNYLLHRSCLLSRVERRSFADKRESLGARDARHPRISALDASTKKTSPSRRKKASPRPSQIPRKKDKRNASPHNA